MYHDVKHVQCLTVPTGELVNYKPVTSFGLFRHCLDVCHCQNNFTGSQNSTEVLSASKALLFLFLHPTLHMLLLATTKVILDAFISSHSHFLVLNKLCHVLLSFVSAFSVDNVLALFTMILWSFFLFFKPSEMHDLHAAITVPALPKIRAVVLLC